jgi:hypothetical protein
VAKFRPGQEVLVHDSASQLGPGDAEVCRGSVSRVTGTIAWVTLPPWMAADPLSFSAATGLQLTCRPRYRIAEIPEDERRLRAARATLLGYGLALGGGSGGLLAEQLEAIARILDHAPRAWTYGSTETVAECSCGGTYTVPGLPAARLAGLAPEEEQAALDAAHAAHIRAVVNGSV